MTQAIILTGGTWTPPLAPKIQRSLGPYRIASALEDAGYSSFVLDYLMHMTIDEVKRALDKHLSSDTLWLGFSSTFFWSNQELPLEETPLQRMYFTDVEFFHEIINYVKEKTTAKIVYGGSKAPYNLADKNVDYYVTGYGDNSIVALTRYIETNDITHLPHSSEHIIDGETRYIIDSGKYPEPKMNEVQTRWWNKEYNILPNEGLPIELARGCIFKCKFCSYPLLGKKKGTYLRDPEEIRDELIKIYEAHGTTSYYFADDTFNDDNDKIEALHKVFTSLPFQPKFSAYLRIDLINRYPHQADLLSEMGLIGNYFGLETMHPDSAKAIGKGLSPNKVKDRLYWLQDKWKNKVNMAAGFILGLPYDNIQYFDELINWCMEKDNPIQNIAFYPLYMYPHLKKNLKEYASEFSLNPEIYGYEFDHPTTPNFWKLKDSPLSFELCREIARRFHNAVSPNNKISEFQMITALNTGIELQDLYTLTTSELYTKYDIISLNNSKILEYKKMIGAVAKD